MGFDESASLVRYVRVVAVARPESTASMAGGIPPPQAV